MSIWEVQVIGDPSCFRTVSFLISGVLVFVRMCLDSINGVNVRRSCMNSSPLTPRAPISILSYVHPQWLQNYVVLISHGLSRQYPFQMQQDTWRPKNGKRNWSKSHETPLVVHGNDYGDSGICKYNFSKSVFEKYLLASADHIKTANFSMHLRNLRLRYGRYQTQNRGLWRWQQVNSRLRWWTETENYYPPVSLAFRLQKVIFSHTVVSLCLSKVKLLSNLNTACLTNTFPLSLHHRTVSF